MRHNPLKSSTIDQCAAGAETLMNVLLDVAGLVEAGTHACVETPVTERKSILLKDAQAEGC